MFLAIKQLCVYSKEALKTSNFRQGKEFACYPLVENLGISFFFADLFILAEEANEPQMDNAESYFWAVLVLDSRGLFNKAW